MSEALRSGPGHTVTRRSVRARECTYLQSRIDLEKEEAARSIVDKELDRAGVAVLDQPAETTRSLAQLLTEAQLSLGVADEWRRRLLDHLLVTTLYRALALSDRQHVAEAVAKQLHLDVAAASVVALEIDAVVLEERRALLLGSLEAIHELALALAYLNANTATAASELQHDLEVLAHRARRSASRAW